MKIDKLTKKQRYLIFFGLILPVCLITLIYSIYNVIYFEPTYTINCAGDVFVTKNKTKAEIQVKFCNEHILPKINKIRLNINMSYLFNDSNTT